LSPGEFDWRREPYEFVSDRLAFDLLAGTDRWRKALHQGVSAADLAAEWSAAEAVWREERRPVLLY
jgi:hypothetical protein